MSKLIIFFRVTWMMFKFFIDFIIFMSSTRKPEQFIKPEEKKTEEEKYLH